MEQPVSLCGLSKVLFIGNIWPEPKSTAAGWRTTGLISCFKEYGYEVHYAATTSINEHANILINTGISVQEILLNDDSFNVFISELNPEIVVFDRFMMEEQFGWRVRDICRNALTILDTSDLHFLRIKRGELLSKKKKITHEEIKLRELGSILRSDLALIISEVEKNLLVEMGIPKNLLYYLPFMVNIPNVKKWNSFENRSDFITIGSFLHAPNIDQLRFLKTSIWPLIRRDIPNAEMHCYGAYCKEKHLQLTDSKSGFFIKGFTDDAQEKISKYKVLLAPLRFGAGLKGKLIEAAITGTPSVTTAIGKEGIVTHEEKWAGAIFNDNVLFAKAAVELYLDRDIWKKASDKSLTVLEERFDKKLHNTTFISYVEDRLSNLKNTRSNNLMGSILNYHTNRSTKFMSMWIESKNKQ